MQMSRDYSYILPPARVHQQLASFLDLGFILVKMFHAAFGFPSFSISFFMPRHSFSRSMIRCLMSTLRLLSLCCALTASAWAARPVVFCSRRLAWVTWASGGFSELSETKNQLATEVRRRSCSKKST